MPIFRRDSTTVLKFSALRWFCVTLQNTLTRCLVFHTFIWSLKCLGSGFARDGLTADGHSDETNLCREDIYLGPSGDADENKSLVLKGYLYGIFL